MKKRLQKVELIKKKIVPILKKNKVKRAGIFGSYARGEEKKNSDVDILVEVQKDWSLIDLAKIKIILEESLKKKVDLLEYEMIHPLIKKNALEEEIRII